MHSPDKSSDIANDFAINVLAISDQHLSHLLAVDNNGGPGAGPHSGG